MTSICISLLACFRLVLPIADADPINSESPYIGLFRESKNDTVLIACLEQLSLIPLDQRDTSLLYAKALRNIGSCLNNLNQPDSALFYYNTTLDLLRNQKRDRHPEYAKTCAEIGILYRDLSDYNSADSMLQIAVSISKEQESDESPNYLSHLFNYILVQRDLGEYERAKMLLEELLHTQEKVLGKQDRSYALSLSILSTLYVDLGNFEKAESSIYRSLEITRQLDGDQSLSYANALQNLCYYYGAIGDYKSDLEQALRVLSIRTHLMDTTAMLFATSHINVGACYLHLGDHKNAMFHLKEALDILRQYHGNQNPTFSTCLQLLGIVNQEIGNYDVSSRIMKESADIHEQIYGANHPGYGNVMYTLGNMYMEANQPDSAMYYARKGLAIQSTALGDDHPLTANSMIQLGGCFLQMNILDSAEHYTLRAAQILAQTFGEENESYAATLNNLGAIYSASKKHTLAATQFRRVVEIMLRLRGNDDPDFIYTSSTLNLGDEYRLMGRYDSATFYYKKFLDIKASDLGSQFAWLSTRERNEYWHRWEPHFSTLISLPSMFPEQPQSFNEISYNSALIAKALMLETCREADHAVATSNDQHLKENYRRLKQLRSGYSKMLSEGSDKTTLMITMKHQADSLDRVLMNSLDAYSQIHRSLSKRWTDIRDSLSRNEAVLEFVRYYNDTDSSYHYSAFVVRKNVEAPMLVRIGSEQDLRASIKFRDYTALYKFIWKPLETKLKGVTKIYYSPVGALNNVSFASLQISASKSGENNKPKYLMDTYSLHRLTTTRYVADGRLTRPKSLSTNVLLIGAIDYDALPTSKTLAQQQNHHTSYADVMRSLPSATPMPLLPATKTEVATIGGVLDSMGWTYRMITGDEASEGLVKASSGANAPGVLHLATHGFAFPETAGGKRKGLAQAAESQYRVSEDPMVRCGIMLSGSNVSWTGNSKLLIEKSGEDGVLTAAEVAELDLSQTSLVVLSACKTGLGRIEGNEGTFGLQRGFKLAGVDQIIVSLWSVPDQETMELMTAFYSELVDSKNAVDSFERAQKIMRDRYPNEPEKWAGFVFVR